MDRKLAEQLGNRIVASTTGWTEESVTELGKMLLGWHDEESGRDAVEEVLNTWTARTRPPLGVFATEYRSQRARRQREYESPTHPDEPFVAPSEGKKIARKAYAQECARQGREPNWAYFERIFAGIVEEL